MKPCFWPNPSALNLPPPEIMETFLFYAFSTLTIGSALAVILHPKPTRALLLLIITMVGLSALYLLLGAYFISIAQIIVYAGAVLVLFLFVIMLQGIGAKDLPVLKRFHPVFLGVALAVSIAFAVLLIQILTSQSFPALRGVQGTVQNIGRSLFRDFLLPFELTSVLLLLGVFAAVALAKKEDLE